MNRCPTDGSAHPQSIKYKQMPKDSCRQNKHTSIWHTETMAAAGAAAAAAAAAAAQLIIALFFSEVVRSVRCKMTLFIYTSHLYRT